MRKIVLVLLLSSAGLFGFIGYSMLLMNWLQDIQTRRYEQHGLNVLLTTLGLVLYTSLAIQFIRHKTTRY